MPDAPEKPRRMSWETLKTLSVIGLAAAIVLLFSVFASVGKTHRSEILVAWTPFIMLVGSLILSYLVQIPSKRAQT